MKINNVIAVIFLLLFPLSSLAESVSDDTLHVLFTGDVLLDRGVRNQIEQESIDSILSDINSLFHANDAVMINLECPLSSKRHPVSKQIVFCGDTIMASALRRNGVTHAALANNHSIDQGFLGLKETCSCLVENGIKVVGYGDNYTQQIAPAIIKKGDIKIAVFNDNIVPLENWSCTSRNKPNILNISVDSLCLEIQRFHKKNPDYWIVAFLHWGAEFHINPSISQQIDAMKLVNAGVSAIIGHHPHVIQQAVHIKNIPVFFSIGNFIFDQSRKNTDKGIAVELLFTTKGLIDTRSHFVKITNCHPKIIKNSD